jgi:hypothetical protein
MIHPNDLAALARSRQEDALAWAERRRLLQLAAGAGAGDPDGSRWDAQGRQYSADLQRSIAYLGSFVRGVVLVALLLVAATVISGLIADPGAGAGAAAALASR